MLTLQGLSNHSRLRRCRHNNRHAGLRCLPRAGGEAAGLLLAIWCVRADDSLRTAQGKTDGVPESASLQQSPGSATCAYKPCARTASDQHQLTP